MRLDKDSFFFLDHKEIEAINIGYRGPERLTYRFPRPFSVALHSPVEFHLLLLLIYCPVPTEPATDLHLCRFVGATYTILKQSCHSCFPQSRLFQHFQQRGLSRIV